MESSEIYIISPIQLRNLGLEDNTDPKQHPARNRDNAYDGQNTLDPARTHLTREQKEARYDTLKESIQHKGFRWEYPIIIMLKRENTKDQILDGHHRLQIAIELGIATVPVSFQTVDSTRSIT